MIRRKRPCTASFFNKDNLKFGNKTIRLVITDYPGRTVMISYNSYGKLAFIFLIYDVTNKASFESLSSFVEDLKSDNNEETRLLYIIGNKSDNKVRAVD